MNIDVLKEALQFYDIKVCREEENKLFLEAGYEIEAEKNKMYKLLQDGYIIAPFVDLNELCRFILQDRQQ